MNLGWEDEAWESDRLSAVCKVLKGKKRKTFKVKISTKFGGVDSVDIYFWISFYLFVSIFCLVNNDLVDLSVVI